MSILRVLRKRTETLNVAELAALLRVAEETVQRWARRRQIPSIRIGNVIRFDGTMLADLVEAQGAATRKNVRPCVQPRAPANSEDYQLKWTDLGELNPEQPSKPKGGTE